MTTAIVDQEHARSGRSPHPLPTLATARYTRVLVIDSNIVLEARPFEQLPWSELGTGPILLLVCPQVSGEIDGKKQDARLGQRARDFAKRLDAALETGGPVQVVDGATVVDLALVTPNRIEWDAFDALDPTSPDDRIVAEALHARVDHPDRLEIMSFDVRPRHKGALYGLIGQKPADSWLRSNEPTKKDGRIVELETELALLRKTQPEMTINIVSPQPVLSRLKVGPPSPDELDMLAGVLRGRYPVIPAPGKHMLETVQDRSDRHQDERWRRDLIHRDLPMAHRGVERLFGQQPLEIVIDNTGALTADQLHVTARSNSAMLHSRPYVVHALGAPHPDEWEPHPGLDTDGLLMPDRFAFATIDEGPGPTISWRCADFRPGRSHRLQLFADISQHSSQKLHVEISITCSNMKGQLPARIVVPIAERKMTFAEAVDVRKGAILDEYPAEALIAAWERPSPNVFRSNGAQVDD